MKIKKIFLLLTFLIIGLIIFMPNRVNATTEIELEGIKYNLEDGNATLIKYTGTESELEIPAKISYNNKEYSVNEIKNGAFENCNEVKKITIPNSITLIGETAFFICENLEEINVVSDNNTYTSINGILFDKNITKLIRCPEGKKETTYSIPNSVKYIEYGAFMRVESLVEIEIPNSVTSIERSAFNSCSSLERIEFNEGLSYIGEMAFKRCSSLKRVDLPSSVSTISRMAFHLCRSLEYVKIPNSVNLIEDDAFADTGEKLTIYGAKDSFAEEFAIKNTINFVKIYNVVFDANGGYFSDGTGKVEMTDWTFDLINDQEIPTCGNKLFLGWSTTNSGGFLINDETDLVNSNTTLYARWIEKVSDGITPQLRVNSTTNEWEISVDNGLTWATTGVNATGKDGISPKLQLNEKTGELEISYDNGGTWTSLGKVVGKDGVDGKDGKDGKDGVDGKDGKDGTNASNTTTINGVNGKDGITPKIQINNKTGELEVSYDNGGTWTSLGKVVGENGITPRIRVNPETNELEVSYDNSKTWESLGVTIENGIILQNNEEFEYGMREYIIIGLLGFLALTGNLGWIIKRKK